MSDATANPTVTVTLPREVSPFELLMLRGESDPRQRASGIGAIVLDRVPDFDRFQQVFERASRVFPRLRQKVVMPALPIGPAVWVIDPDFDIDFHVRRMVLPGGATIRDLLDLAQLENARPYDLARPLWEILLVEGLNDPAGPAGMLLRFHHAMTDGLGAVEMNKQIYDFERDADRGPMPPVPVPEDLEPMDLARRQLRGLPLGLAGGAGRVATRLARFGRRAVASPGRTVQDIGRVAGSTRRVLAGAPAEPSPLLRRRSLGRRFDYIEFPLDRFRRAARAGGGSLNDAYISALCGTLRRYHDALGVPVETVPLALPVSVRKAGDTAGGNHWAAAFIAAPVGVTDPAKRIEIIHEQVVEAVAEPALDALSVVAPVLARIPPAFMGALAGMVGGNDVQASNVPGYVQTPYIAGAKLVKNLPFGPLPGVPMMTILYTEGGQCFVGVNYDTASFTEQGLLATCLHEGFDEVLALDPEPTRRPESRPAARSVRRAAKRPARTTATTRTARTS